MHLCDERLQLFRAARECLRRDQQRRTDRDTADAPHKGARKLAEASGMRALSSGLLRGLMHIFFSLDLKWSG
jgi:hypothetical protein